VKQAWLGVVSRSHVERGIAGGFAQVCHGKEAPLKRMKAGDTFIYYSPTIEMNGAPLQAFTAFGCVQDDEVFQFDMGGGFVPFRRRIAYVPAKEVALNTLRGQLELCASPNWGMALRRGMLLLSASDADTIGGAMGAR
jgi:EVE domain